MAQRSILAAAFGIALGVVVTPASAAVSWTWQMTSGCSDQLSCGAYAGSGAGAPTLTSVTGWSFTADNGGTNNALDTAWLTAYSGGIGLRNRDASTVTTSGDYQEGTSPEHTIDNNQRYDMVLLSFGSAVTLDSVVVGWRQYDSDLTVLAYQGVSPFSASTLSTRTTSGLASQGWKLVGHYDGPSGSSTSQTSIAINTNDAFTSQYWLIGAYNPNFSIASLITPASQTIGSPNNNFGTGYDNRDYVKLFSVAATSPTVPEPSSALLLGAAAFGLWRFRRKATAR